MIRTTVTGAEAAMLEIQKAIEEFTTNEFVTIGIHEEAGGHDSGDITNAQLGATLHFGADIDHPGGTVYGFASKAAADRNEVRFLKSGKGYAELGVTGPHKIKIPPRPWLTPGVESGNDEYLKIITDAAEKQEPLSRALKRVGVVAEAKVKVYMTQLKSPPNALSTVKKKGSSNPLIDSGQLRASVTSKIVNREPDEGL